MSLTGDVPERPSVLVANCSARVRTAGFFLGLAMIDPCSCIDDQFQGSAELATVIIWKANSPKRFRPQRTRRGTTRTSTRGASWSRAKSVEVVVVVVVIYFTH